LLRSPLKDQEERDEVAANVAFLLRPADGPRVLARVAALLTPYYTGDVPNGVRMIEAEDWAEALDGLPEWAITKACRWWKGDENVNRRKKPFEGDIVARARFEMGALRVAGWAVERFDDGLRPKQPEPARQAPSPEDVAHRRAFAESVIKGKFPSMRAKP